MSGLLPHHLLPFCVECELCFCEDKFTTLGKRPPQESQMVNGDEWKQKQLVPLQGSRSPPHQRNSNTKGNVFRTLSCVI